MTASEFSASLTPEQTTALIEIRDSIMASNQTAMGELVAAKAGELANLQKQITDKDIALEAIIANMKEDAESAAIEAKRLADAAIATATATLDADKKRAEDELAKVSDANEKAIQHLSDALKLSGEDLDTLTAKLSATQARQDQLAAAAAALADSLVSVASQVKALATEAGKDLAAKQEEARQVAINKMQADLDALKNS